MRTFVFLLCGSLLVGSEAAAQGAPPSTVRTDAVVQALLQERRTVSGDLRAAQRARVAAEEAGRVLEIHARDGAQVQAGSLLVTLDGEHLRLQLAVLEAREAGVRAVVVERQATLAQALRDLETLEDLVARKVANDKELADARTAVEQARARLAQGENELVVLAAEVALQRERLADTQVRAPFDGVVARLETELGEWLGAGDAVLELVSNELEVWLRVPQSNLAALREQKGPMTVQVAGQPERYAMPAWRLVPIVDTGARMLTLIGSLPSDPALAPGMSATAWVPVAGEAQHSTVSVDAMLRNELGPFLYVAMPQAEGPSLARPVQVKVLWQEGDRLVVSGPLQAGDATIVEGKERLYPMAPVLPAAPAPGTGGGN